MELVSPTVKHIVKVATGLRSSDRAELGALSPEISAAVALQECAKASVLCWTMLHKGQTVALTGVCANVDGTGAPWLVGTNAIKAVPVSFMRSSRKAVDAYISRFSRLENYVLSSEQENVGYVVALGFTLGELVQIGSGTFYKFYMER